jgi:hypothetical protein
MPRDGVGNARTQVMCTLLDERDGGKPGSYTSSC